MKCKCKYFLRNDEGVLICTACGKPAKSKAKIEDKMTGAHEDKAPLYVSDKDKLGG